MNSDKYIIILIIFLITILYINNLKESFSNNEIHPMNIYFDSVNVITIPKRKKYIKNLMNFKNIKVNLIDATLVKNINYDKLLKDNFVSSEYYSDKNKGRIACHLSQIKLIKNFVNSKDETIFIFEDDIDKDIIKNYKDIIKNSMENIPDDWDIVFFGRCYDNCKQMKQINNNLYQVYEPLCRHAYGLSKKGAEKILKYTVPMIDNGDQMYKNNINNGNITAYAIHPDIFLQNRNDMDSNIGNTNFLTKILKKKNIKILFPTCSSD